MSLYERKNGESAGSSFDGAEKEKDAVAKEGGSFFYDRIFGRMAVDDLGDIIKSSSRVIGFKFLAAIITFLIC